MFICTVKKTPYFKNDFSVIIRKIHLYEFHSYKTENFYMKRHIRVNFTEKACQFSTLKIWSKMCFITVFKFTEFSINRYSDKNSEFWAGLFLVNDMQTSPPPLKSGQIVFLVQKDALCSETYEKTFFRLLFFWEMVDFVLEIHRILRFFSRLEQNAFQKILRTWKKKFRQISFL